MSERESNNEIAGFFSREWDRLLGYLQSRLPVYSRYEAEDLLQDVALRMVSNDRSGSLDNIAAYVYTALRNRLRDWVRRKRDTDSLDMEIADGLTLGDLVSDHVNHPVEELERSFQLNCLYRSLAKLSDEKRELVIAFHFEGKSVSSLARKTGVPTGTLLSRKKRALDELRNHLEKCFEEG